MPVRPSILVTLCHAVTYRYSSSASTVVVIGGLSLVCVSSSYSSDWSVTGGNVSHLTAFFKWIVYSL